MKRQGLFIIIVLSLLLASMASEAVASPAAAQGGWRAEYYANRNLSGAPTLVRYDVAIDFDWKNGSPDPTIPVDGFSARWVRTLYFSAGTYRFFSSSNEGSRIDVDGGRVLEAWDGPHATRWGDVVLTEGQHTILVEYYEGTGDASVHVWWKRLGSFSGWEGRYYDNVELRGGPTLIRDDREINFDWGEGGPAVGMPGDKFSVVWTRQIDFSPGVYRLNVRADDGVRVWLDDGLVMDYWRPQEYEWHYADGFYLAGNHTLRVEYFERGGGARIRFWWELSSTTPSPEGPGQAPRPVPSPTSTPISPRPWTGQQLPQVCEGGPLRMDAWPVAKRCNPGGGWTATVFVEGHGGACRYTYAWEGQVKGDPTPNSMTFEVKSAGWNTAIVGAATATSAGETVKVKLHIPHPSCMRK